MPFWPFRRRDSVPDWAAFFNRKRFERFMGLVDDYWSELGREVEIQDGVLRVVGSDEPMGLQNLAQVCHQSPPDEWAEVIANHFGLLETTREERAELEGRIGDFEAVRHQLGLRLYPADFIDGPVGEAAVFRRDLPGTVTVLVVDLPSSVANIPRDEVGRWRLSDEELFAAARESTRVLAESHKEEVELSDTVTVTLIGGDSYFAASNVLLLDQHHECIGPHGALVGVPHRHAAIVYPVTGIEVVHAVNGLIPVIHGMHQEGPGSISPSLYWYRDGEFLELPYEIGEDGIRFIPPEAFVLLLNRLAEQAD